MALTSILSVNITSHKSAFHTSKSGTTTALRCGNLDAVDAVGHGLSFHRAFGGGQPWSTRPLCLKSWDFQDSDSTFSTPTPEVNAHHSSHVGVPEVDVLRDSRAFASFVSNQAEFWKFSCCWCKWVELNKSYLHHIYNTQAAAIQPSRKENIPCLNRLKVLLNLELRQPSSCWSNTFQISSSTFLFGFFRKRF